MALTVKDIIEENMFPGTVLLTGRESAGNLIKWVTVNEILDSVDMIGEGELLITTGYDFSNVEAHKNLIGRLKKNGVAGIMIQTGYYIDSVPIYMLEAARKYKFPILELPARYRFSEVLRKLITAINEKSGDRDRHFLDYDFFYSLVRKGCIEAASNAGTAENQTWLFAFSAHEMNGNDGEKFMSLLDTIRRYLMTEKCYLEDWNYGTQAVFLLSFPEEEQMKRSASDIHDMIIRTSDFTGLQMLGCGAEVEHPETLKESFSRCIEVFYLFRSIGAKRGFCLYEHVPHLRRFANLYKNDITYAREHSVLQELARSDRENNTEYLRTLRFFLEEKCNVSRAAARVYVHRHTFLNRLAVIREKTGFDYNDFVQRLDLGIALEIHDYFGP